MHKANELREVQLEISSNCQAGCMECGRWKMHGDKQILNPNIKFGPAGNMKFDLIKEVFDREKLPEFNFIALDGNYGDSLIHPQSLEIMEYLFLTFGDKTHSARKTTIPLQIEVNTNGGYWNTDYWHELGKLFAKHYLINNDYDSCVVFGIDGIDNETHDKYRRNVVFDKTIANAEAFIKGGGKAQWKYLEFDHNMHQTDKAKELAKQMGFKKFFVKRTRWVDAALREIIEKKQTGEESGTKVKGAKLGNKEGAEYSRIPESKKDFVQQVEKQVKQFNNYFDEVPISCSWRNRKRIQIEYDGTVWQCCHFSPVYGSGGRMKLYTGQWEIEKNKEYAYYRNTYGNEWNNLYKHTLSNILEHSYFDSIERSWNNKTNAEVEPRLSRCVEKCAITTQDMNKTIREKL
jgi:hypothetical protein